MDKNDFNDIQKNMKRNEIFTQVNRFIIMLVLRNYESIQFNELQALIKITPGNLDHHLKILENNGLVLRKTRIIIKNIRVTVEITNKGQDELDIYLKSMKDIIKRVEESEMND